MRRNLIVLFGALMLLAATVAATPATAGHNYQHITVRTGLAPVAANGLTVGAPTDFVITLRDVDPTVPGVGLHAGGTIRVTLPDQFVNTESLPIAATGSSPTCAPPLVTSCSTAVLLQGWPQSPRLPFPDVTWEADTNTIVMTATADWMPAGVSAPGPKQIHLLLLGFTNPTRRGSYRIDVAVQPDPADDLVLEASGRVKISEVTRPMVSSISLANGAPPPPFPNPLFQSIAAGDPSLTLLLYLWGPDMAPLVGANFEPGSDRNRPLYDAEGRSLGRILVRPPRGADNWSFASGGPAQATTAFLTGFDTASMTAVLQTDPDVAGEYLVVFRLRNGNTVRHVITAE